MFDRIGQGIYWDKFWRLVDGCTPCSPGCERCWSARYTHRFDRIGGHRYFTSEEGKFKSYLELRYDSLDRPLHAKKPRCWFILNDLFHKQVPTQFIDRALEIMAATPQHIYLLLTKRANLIEEKLYGPTLDNPGRELGGGDSIDNVWPGVTVCNQEEADKKIPPLLQIPAAVRWLSIEPMLGPVDPNVEWGQGVGELALESGRINWVVLGTESGPGRRPANIEDMINVVNQCRCAGIPVFVKQVEINGKTSKGPSEWPEELRIRELPECK